MPCFIFVSASSSHAVQVITTLVSLMSQYGNFGFVTRRLYVKEKEAQRHFGAKW